MMRILILIIMLLPCSLGMYASAIDSLLSVLDKTIVMRRQYEEEKERYISLIKDELKQRGGLLTWSVSDTKSSFLPNIILILVILHYII